MVHNYILTDFLNDKVDVDRFTDEIQSSPVITKALGDVTVSGSSVVITFKEALPQAQSDALDALVTAHTGEPLADPNSLLRSDGRIVVEPVSFTTGEYLYIAGAGDDLVGGVRGGGDTFLFQRTDAGEESLDFGFVDDVSLKSGGIQWKGAELGDWVTLELYAPATPVVPNGGSSGNCNLVDIGGGAMMLVPAAGDGAYDVVLTDAVPVPSDSSTGYWNRDANGDPTPSLPGQGAYNAFAFGPKLVRHANKVHILGAGFLPSIGDVFVKESGFLRQWRGRVILHKETTGGSCDLVFSLNLGRKVTLNTGEIV